MSEEKNYLPHPVLEAVFWVCLFAFLAWVAWLNHLKEVAR